MPVSVADRAEEGNVRLNVNVVFAFAFFLFSMTLLPAMAEKRLALVIGNNIYRNLSDREQLQSGQRCRSGKAGVESLNFKVDLGENLDRAALVGKLSDFGARLETGDIAFFSTPATAFRSAARIISFLRIFPSRKPRDGRGTKISRLGGRGDPGRRSIHDGARGSRS